MESFGRMDEKVSEWGCDIIRAIQSQRLMFGIKSQSFIAGGAKAEN